MKRFNISKDMGKTWVTVTVKNPRVSFVCRKAAELRKGKTETELTQHDAFVLANIEWHLMEKLEKIMLR